MPIAAAIGPLTKVALKLTVSGERGQERPTAAIIRFEFVFGIGTQGLSAFEMDLSGLSEGARKKIQIEAHETQLYFEHLRCPLLEALRSIPPFDLEIEVLSVTPVTDRELVYALANKEGSGCDCDCDCGC